MKYGKTENEMEIWGNMHTFNIVNECSLFLIQPSIRHSVSQLASHTITISNDLVGTGQITYQAMLFQQLTQREKNKGNYFGHNRIQKLHKLWYWKQGIQNCYFFLSIYNDETYTKS